MKGKPFSKVLKTFWKYWERKRFLVNSLLSCLPIILYFLGYLPNIRENTGSLISFAVGILTVEGVFLTLLVTLKSSPVMARLKNFFPNLHDHLYKELRRQIADCIYYILINLAIAIGGPISNIYVIVIGILLWSYLTVSVTLGILYSINTVMNLATADVETRHKMR
ncbi:MULTISPECIES: hypothetical protein [Bacillus]|uniref:hypothetical protein n=1 Tax=Bacillus TaxID=1386 RepID=UPI000D02A1A6|nr:MULTISPECIES: hypothetical protein [Bacillus]PRS78886.1 hypothetical protein C6346_16235 [Bacillus sp. CJCL2]PRS82557.1 hypothetical protein C6348_16865 [Bacillus sp. YBWC18]QNP16978.1 hypothetical protein H9S87_02925 [Bacillus pumilus]